MTKSFFIFICFALIGFSGLGQTVTFADVKGGVILKDSLLSSNTLKVDAPFTILQFTMVHFAKDAVYEYQSLSNMLTTQMLYTITKSKSGDRISFEGIKAIGSEGKLYKLKAITIKIK